MDLLFIVVFIGSGAALFLSFFSLINPRVGFGKTPAISCGIYLAIFAGLIIGLKIAVEIQKPNSVNEGNSTNLNADIQHADKQKPYTNVLSSPNKELVREN